MPDAALTVLDDDTVALVLSGDWLVEFGLASPSDVMRDLAAVRAEGRKASSLRVDARRVGRWDSSLILYLFEISQALEREGRAIDPTDVPDGIRSMLDLATKVPEREGARREESKAPFVKVVGEEVLSALKSSRDMVRFLGEACVAFVGAVTGRARFRARDLLSIIEDCGARALPIVALISILIGMILAFVGAVQLQQFGAQVYVANLVGLAMVREIGGIMTAIILAGRTGAAFAAQLGTMKVNEEIDAFQTLGIQPMEFLVLPRMLAMILMMPLLVIYANVIGMFGGALVAAGTLDVSFLQYYQQLSGAVTLTDWVGGLIKAALFGVIVAIAGCLRGIQAGNSAASVGNAATSAVVTAIVFIIVADAILTVVYTVLGV